MCTHSTPSGRNNYIWLPLPSDQLDTCFSEQRRGGAACQWAASGIVSVLPVSTVTRSSANSRFAPEFWSKAPDLMEAQRALGVYMPSLSPIAKCICFKSVRKTIEILMQVLFEGRPRFLPVHCTPLNHCQCNPGRNLPQLQLQL